MNSAQPIEVPGLHAIISVEIGSWSAYQLDDGVFRYLARSRLIGRISVQSWGGMKYFSTKLVKSIKGPYSEIIEEGKYLSHLDLFQDVIFYYCTIHCNFIFISIDSSPLFKELLK